MQQHRTLNVGVIGLNVDGAGWAAEGHAPAIRAVDGLALAGVATRSEASARRAADRFDIPRAYASVDYLIADPEIDIVAVISPVPTHADHILAAARAGKHVLTEWPVAPGAEQMRSIAEEVGATVRHAVNLQGRQSAAVQTAAALVRDGELGRIRSINVLSTTAGFGRDIPAAYGPLEDPETWTHLGTIQTAHTLDAVLALAGPLDDLRATLDVQHPDLVVDDGRMLHRTLPDHVLLSGRFASGATLTMEILGGRPADRTPFRLEVFGDRGELAVVGGAPRGFQAGTLSLSRDGEPQAGSAPDAGGLAPSAVNVARVYAALRDDILHGTSTAPTLEEAARLATLLEDVGIGRLSRA